MKCSDIDLGHRPPACLAHHLHATRGLEIDSNLGNFGHTFRTQKALGEIAVWAHGGRVHHDVRHHALSIKFPAQAPVITRFSRSANPPRPRLAHLRAAYKPRRSRAWT